MLQISNKLTNKGDQMKLFKLVVALFTATAITSSVNAAEIKMAKANWDTGYFQAEIYKQALEKMGHKIS